MPIGARSSIVLTRSRVEVGRHYSGAYTHEVHTHHSIVSPVLVTVRCVAYSTIYLILTVSSIEVQVVNFLEYLAIPPYHLARCEPL